MSLKVISYDTKRVDAIREKRKITREYEGFNESITGEMNMQVTGKQGKKLFTSDAFLALKKAPQGEMNSSQIKEMLKQVVLDISSEEAIKPPLYTEIYEEIKDKSFPASVEVKDVIGLNAAFGIVGDGESIPLADFKVENMGSAHFKTYATGYSITEEWVEFNQFWKIELANKALGEAHNAILDHIHLSPIFTAKMEKEAKTDKWEGKTEEEKKASALTKIYNSLRAGLQDALKRRTARGYIFKPSVLICNSATSLDVESAIKGETEKGKTFGSIGMIDKIIVYDGWAGTVNNVKYDFKGPQDNEVYLIEPKRGFKALVKKDVTRIEQKGNVLRLGNLDVAQYFMRAVVADIANGVHKITIA